MLEQLLKQIKEEFFKVITELGITDAVILPNSDAILLEIPKDKTNGDYATNIAMKLAKVAHQAPIQIANKIIEKIDTKKVYIKSISVANPGFINMFIDTAYFTNIIFKINEQGQAFGSSSIGNGENICLEYVSANPTGYLHVGHGRGAAYGASLANILKKAGYQVNREHYVNDAGNQITNMALSVYARYEELFGRPLNLPEDGYHGKEIITIAEKVKEEYGDKYLDNYDQKFFREYGTEKLLNILKETLKTFNVEFDTWFSETSLYQAGKVQEVLAFLKEHDFTYESEGATWLKTTLYNDEKDRVIVKSDGSYTYLLPDIAYHANKLSRGYTHLIDVLGADHHGYIDRLHAAVSMVGGNSDLIDVDILQMVRVIENGEEVKMSKRSGKAITLVDLIQDVGTDALRYFYIDKSLSTHMDLDLNIMKEQSNNNPVYYVQYAHARIQGVFEKAEKLGIKYQPVTKFNNINQDTIKPLCQTLALYPSIIEEIATKRNVHKITHYLYELASLLHSYYNDEKIITDNLQETNEKLTVLQAVRTVLQDALSLIGVSAPDHME